MNPLPDLLRGDRIPGDLALGRLVADRVARAGGRAWFAGATARDRLLGRTPTRVRLLVGGLPEDVFVALGREMGAQIDGPAGGRLQVRQGDAQVETSLAPHDAPAAAVAMADVTIDALLEDPRTGEVLDPAGGRADLERRVVRFRTPEHAAHPTAGFRVAELAARLEMTVADDVLAACRGGDPLRAEAGDVLRHVALWLLDARAPVRGLTVLAAAGALRRVPPLARLAQDAASWQRTAGALERAATLRARSPRPLPFLLAALLHALPDDVTLQRALAGLVGDSPLHDEVADLVLLHQAPDALADLDDAEDPLLARLALLVDPVQLGLLGEATGGRGAWLVERATSGGVPAQPPVPFLDRARVLALGVPAADAEDVIDAAFDLQLDGALRDVADAEAYARGRAADPQ